MSTVEARSRAHVASGRYGKADRTSEKLGS